MPTEFDRWLGSICRTALHPRIRFRRQIAPSDAHYQPLCWEQTANDALLAINAARRSLTPATRHCYATLQTGGDYARDELLRGARASSAAVQIRNPPVPPAKKPMIQPALNSPHMLGQIGDLPVRH